MKLGLNQLWLALLGIFINIGTYNLYDIVSERIALFAVIYGIFSIALVRVLKKLA